MTRLNLLIVKFSMSLVLMSCSSGGQNSDLDTETAITTDAGTETETETGTGTETVQDASSDSETGDVDGYVLLAGQVDFTGVTVSLDGTDKDVLVDEDGHYRFDDVPPGTYTVTVALSGYESIVSNPFEVVGGQTRNVPPITLSAPPGSMSGNFQLDGQSDHAGIQVAVDGTSLSTLTDADGDWHFDVLPVGNYTVRANRKGYDEVSITDQRVSTGQLTQVPAASLFMLTTLYLRYASGGSLSGDPAQTGTVAQNLNAPFVVEVLDALDRGVENILVSFAVTAGNGTMVQSSVLTDSQGQAFSTLKLGTIAGKNRVVVSSSDTVSQSVSFLATGEPDVPHHLLVAGDEQTGQVGAALVSPLEVTVLDQFDNRLAGRSVAFAATNGSGSAFPVSAMTGTDGSAVTIWTLDQTLDLDGFQSLTATVAGSALTYSFSAANISAAPVLIEIVSGNNQIGRKNTDLSDPLVVFAEDVFGNPAWGWTVVWTSPDGSTVPASFLLDEKGESATVAHLGSNTATVQQFTASVNGHSVMFSASATSHDIDYLFPARMWPDAPVDRTMEIYGIGFAAGAQVIWDAGGAEQVLTPTEITANRIAVPLVSALFARAPGSLNVTVRQGGARCATVKFVIGGITPDSGWQQCVGLDQLVADCGTIGTGHAYYGQDSQFGWDNIVDPVDRYVRNEAVSAEPVVSDALTLLEWQGCAAGVDGATCSNGIATALTLSSAVAYCESLDWGGHTDWSLPTVRELESLVDLHQISPSIDSSFPATPTSEFWASTDNIMYPTLDYAWYVTFSHGYVGYSAVSSPFHVRCVRGVREELEPSLHRDTGTPNQPIVRDTNTGLTWQGCPAGRSGDYCNTGGSSDHGWEAAISYCNGLTWGGFSDWRLPGRNELFSIGDFSRADPTYDSDMFPLSPSENFWSSTIHLQFLTMPWVHSGYGGSLGLGGSIGLTNTQLTRCVRGLP